MFNNLIESSSHATEYKRRGSFLLVTGATYLVMFVVAGVASIYAYDAHLDRQSTELELLSWVPQPQPEPAPEVPRNTISPASNAVREPSRSVRTELIDSVSNPNNVQDQPGTTAPTVPPARTDSIVGSYNADPITPPGSTRGTPNGTGTAPVVEGVPDDPPPAPTPAPTVPKIYKVSVVLNSRALSLPQPNYPPLAKNIRLQGTVIVQVLINEDGNVVSANATSGHPMLVPEAQRAAMRARFSPTVLGDQKVKVQGVITYNFILGN